MRIEDGLVQLSIFYIPLSSGGSNQSGVVLSTGVVPLGVVGGVVPGGKSCRLSWAKIGKVVLCRSRS